jgi:hypothetical protein
MLLINNKNLQYYFKNLSELKSIKNKIDNDIWEDISYYNNLPNNFIIEFNENLNWNIICEYQTLNENLIESFINKIDWNSISEYQKLSEEFLIKYKNKVNWDLIIYNEKIKLSSEFVINNKFLNLNKYIKFVDKKHLTYELILNNKEIFNYNSWKYIFENKKINEYILKLISKYLDKVKDNNLFFKNEQNFIWTIVTITQKLSIKFIKEFKNKLNWYKGSKFLKLNEDLIEEFSKKINWYQIFKYQKINFSKKFILKNLNKFDNYNIHHINPQPNYIFDYGNSEEEINELYLLKKNLKLTIIKKYYIGTLGDHFICINKYL